MRQCAQQVQGYATLGENVRWGARHRAADPRQRLALRHGISGTRATTIGYERLANPPGEGRFRTIRPRRRPGIVLSRRRVRRVECAG
jgi:hypothetical protein